jgi:hypothetical protein
MGKKSNPNTCLMMSVFLLAMVLPAAGKTIYVDDSAAVGGNGQNWATPYRYLQDAMTAAVYGDEIFVGEGVYIPDQNSVYPSGTGSRQATFQLKNGVALRGGYAGLGEPDPDARDIEVYETVLNGDLLGNDEPNFVNNGENSYHVVTGSWTDVTAVVDGFIITGGNANGSNENRYGGGMYNDSGSPTVANCTFSENSAHYSGGMYNFGGSPKLINCTFTGNRSGPLPPPRKFVDAGATGANDGTSWTNAYNDLQDALDAVTSGDEIRVAQGIYKPDHGGGNTPGSRTATFQLINGVVIKGGYAGFGQPDPDARDPNTYETILSGDLAGNDGPNFANNDENSYHVVTGSNCDQTAIIDGFIITAGNANCPLQEYYDTGG